MLAIADSSDSSDSDSDSDSSDSDSDRDSGSSDESDEDTADLTAEQSTAVEVRSSAPAAAAVLQPEPVALEVVPDRSSSRGSTSRPPLAADPRLTQARNLFNTLDKDRDGTISSVEMDQVCF